MILVRRVAPGARRGSGPRGRELHPEDPRGRRYRRVGQAPDWYRNLKAAPALELRIAAQRWDRPDHRFLDNADALRVLRSYQQAHPGAWKRIAPLIGLPAELDEAGAHAVHGVAFTPHLTTADT